MAELASLQRAAVVVEGRYADLFTRGHVQPGFLAGLAAQLQVRYPNVPIVWSLPRPAASHVAALTSATVEAATSTAAISTST